MSVTRDLSDDDERAVTDCETAELLLISDRIELSTSLSDAADRVDPSISLRVVTKTECAERIASEGAIDCVISEYELAETDGLSLFGELRTTAADVPFILYPQAHCEDLATEAIESGVSEYLPQPADTGNHDVLMHTVRRAIVYRRTVERDQRRAAEHKRFERAVDAAGHAVFITDAAGKIEYVNPAFEEITGYDAEIAIGATPRILKSGKMSESYYSTLWETVLSGNVWSKPIVNRRVTGELYHADETIAPITGDAGDIAGFVAIQTDITERVEAYEELETFKRIVERVDDPIMIQDAEGRFELVNDAVSEYAGIETEALLGADESAFMDPTAAEAIAERKREVIAARKPKTYQITPAFSKDCERSFITTRYPKRNEEGVVDGTIAICRDVTDQLERERQLRILVRILRHNINNKMSVILGNAEILRDQSEKESSKLAEHVISASEELIELAETKRRIVELLVDPPGDRSIQLRPMLKRIESTYVDRFPESSIAVQAPADISIEAVPQFSDAVSELVENAIVHAARPDPVIKITATAHGEAIEIEITDNGPGIPPIERDVLSVDAELSQTHHGRGLGLRFADQVLKASGGSLDISTSPTGSTVTLSVPSAESDA